MRLRLWLHLIVISSSLIIADQCKVTESRQLSIYAYTSNILIQDGILETCGECSQTGCPNGCEHAFDNDSYTTDDWRPTNLRPNVTIKVKSQSRYQRDLMMGRFLCVSNSCDCYINQRLLITAITSDPLTAEQQEVYMIPDPFAMTTQKWIRFDFRMFTGIFSLTFPELPCEPQFVEIEIHEPGGLNLLSSRASGPNCTVEANRTHTFFLGDLNQTEIAFVRFMLTASCDEDISELTNIPVEIIRDNDVIYSLTYILGPLDANMTSQAFIQEIDRTPFDSFRVVVKVPGTLTVHMDWGFVHPYLTAQQKLTDLPERRLECGAFPGRGRKGRAEERAELTCTDIELIVDKNTTTYWSGPPGKSYVDIIFDQSTQVDVTMIRILQENIEYLTYSDGNNNDRKCQEMRLREDLPLNSSGWIILQQIFIDVENIRIQFIPFSGNLSRIYEVEIYGTVHAKASTVPTLIPSSTTVSIPPSTTTGSIPPSSTTLEPPHSTSTTTTSPSTSTMPGHITITGATTETVTTDEPIRDNSTSAGTTPISSTTKPTTFTTQSTTTTNPGNPSGNSKVYPYTVTMKILGVTFFVEMADNTSALYRQTNQLYVPLVDDAIVQTIEDRYLPPIYNISYKNGSINMTYTFNVSGTDGINTDELIQNLIGVFNESGIKLDPNIIIIGGPDSNLVLIALVASLITLVVVIMCAVLGFCLRKHYRCCRRRDERCISFGEFKPDDGHTLAMSQYMSSSGLYGNRIWWQSGHPWPQSGLPASAYLTGGIVAETDVNIQEEGAFSYPEPRQQYNPFTGGATSSDNSEQGYSSPGSVHTFDYFTDRIETPLDTSSPPHRTREPVEESDITIQIEITPQSDSEEDDSDQVSIASSEGGYMRNIFSSSLDQCNSGAHMRSRQTSTSSDVTQVSYQLPSLYRTSSVQNNTFKSFFSPELREDAFDLPASLCSPMGRSLPTRLHRSYFIDPPTASESDRDSIASNDSMDFTEGLPYTDIVRSIDSGYHDDALRLYFTDAKLDKLSQSLTRGTSKPDLLHRATPPYLFAEIQKHPSQAGCKNS